MNARLGTRDQEKFRVGLAVVVKGDDEPGDFDWFGGNGFDLGGFCAGLKIEAPKGTPVDGPVVGILEVGLTLFLRFRDTVDDDDGRRKQREPHDETDFPEIGSRDLQLYVYLCLKERLF